MNTAQFCKRVRETAQIPDNSEDWTAGEILREASQCLLERFTQPVQNTRSGYWLQTKTINTTPGLNWYRIPPRAIVQGMELFCMQPPGAALDTTSWYQLSVLTNSQATDFQGTQGGSNPRWFSFENDGIVLYPTPSAAQALQIKYYLRPANLIEMPGEPVEFTLNQQAPVTGVLVAMTPSPLTTLFTVQWNTSAQPSPNDTKYDLVNLDGTSEAVILDMPLASYAVIGPDQANAVFTFTISALETAKLRFDGTQAIVPASEAWTIPLPQELHSALVAYTSAVILMDKGDIEKATQVISRCEASVKKIIDIMTPRVKDRPYMFKTRNTFLRRRAGWRGVW